jgi:hypothetical protein
MHEAIPPLPNTPSWRGAQLRVVSRIDMENTNDNFDRNLKTLYGNISSYEFLLPIQEAVFCSVS